MRTFTFILDNMILYEKKISILIVIADPRGFIQIIRSYLYSINSITGIYIYMGYIYIYCTLCIYIYMCVYIYIHSVQYYTECVFYSTVGTKIYSI